MPFTTLVKSQIIAFGFMACIVPLNSCKKNSKAKSDSSTVTVDKKEPSIGIFDDLPFEKEDLKRLSDDFQGRVTKIHDSHFFVCQSRGKRFVIQIKGIEGFHGVDIGNRFKPSEADKLNGLKRRDAVWVVPIPEDYAGPYREAPITPEGLIGEWSKWRMGDLMKDDPAFFLLFYALVKCDGDDLHLTTATTFMGNKVELEQMNQELIAKISRSL